MKSDITRIGTGKRMSEAVCYNGIVWVAGQVGQSTFAFLVFFAIHFYQKFYVHFE